MNLKYKNKTASIALNREKFIRKNRYYHESLSTIIEGAIPPRSTVLEVGCGTGYLLRNLKDCVCTGIDISADMIQEARSLDPECKIEFIAGDAETHPFNAKFDYIIISDSLGYFKDVQRVFKNLHKISHKETRIILTYHSFLWYPLLKFAEFLCLKMPHHRLNWLGTIDVKNLLSLEGFEIIKIDDSLLFPVMFPFVSFLCNRFLINFFPFNLFALSSILFARPIPSGQEYSVSIIIPARNEEGNIENAVRRIPQFGTQLEIIFVEGNSTDNTFAEIARVIDTYSDRYSIKVVKQPGKGKGDAVRMGFDIASNDILMILDADLTVPPEDLPKFYDALCHGKGELIIGTRLVYPLEKDSMRFLNMVGNKFFSLLFSWLLGQNIKDTLCGTKVIHKKNWQKIAENRSFFGDFDPFGDFDLLFGASKLNLKILEIPIRYQSRVYGTTNISRFKHGWLLLKMSFIALLKLKLRK
jgi:SAM-dependent methyltransferase